MRTPGSVEYRRWLRSSRARIGLAAVVLAVLAGCSAPEPFVFKDAEFNRRIIGRPAAVPGLIQVCYYGPATTIDAVLRLAEEECAKFGKTPQLIGQEVYVCPMTTPIAANYLCCPSAVEPSLRYRCSAAGGYVERLNNDQVREILAAQRREQRQPTK
jgi:hypothetical protein